ncbi:MAG TPA: hypothetical protein VKF41_05400 [Bryobacteraceae bacterium]|nr:hypothetical protein [Bryobacteraceae bacterium]
MKTDRRGFLFGTPLAALGMAGFGELSFSQTPDAAVPADVVDFWVRDMGVPAHMVLGGQATRGRAPNGPQTSNLAREPLFLHYDPEEGALMPSDQIPTQKMHAFTDAKLDFQLVRMRLNPEDHHHFENYTSGGIYLDFQQGQPQSVFGEMISLATTTFSAIFPGPRSGPAASKSGAKSGSAAKAGSAASKSQAPAQAAAPGAPAGAAAATIPLQAAKQSQTISLPGGLGKTSFACFAKDPRKTLFGSFVDVMSKVVNSPMVSYLPLMSFPVVGAMGLAGIKGLVGSLQAEGAQQQWILQSPPLDVAATVDGSKASPEALRLRSGSYIVIPKEHSAALKDQLGKLKILDGFLVPKEATSMDVFDAAPQTAQLVSYISLRVSVASTKGAKA